MMRLGLCIEVTRLNSNLNNNRKRYIYMIILISLFTTIPSTPLIYSDEDHKLKNLHVSMNDKDPKPEFVEYGTQSFLAVDQEGFAHLTIIPSNWSGPEGVGLLYATNKKCEWIIEEVCDDKWAVRNAPLQVDGDGFVYIVFHNNNWDGVHLFFNLASNKTGEWKIETIDFSPNEEWKKTLGYSSYSDYWEVRDLRFRLDRFSYLHVFYALIYHYEDGMGNYPEQWYLVYETTDPERKGFIYEIGENETIIGSTNPFDIDAQRHPNMLYLEPNEDGLHYVSLKEGAILNEILDHRSESGYYADIECQQNNLFASFVRRRMESSDETIEFAHKEGEEWKIEVVGGPYYIIYGSELDVSCNQNIGIIVGYEEDEHQKTRLDVLYKGKMNWKIITIEDHVNNEYELVYEYPKIIIDNHGTMHISYATVSMDKTITEEQIYYYKKLIAQPCEDDDDNNDNDTNDLDDDDNIYFSPNPDDHSKEDDSETKCGC